MWRGSTCGTPCVDAELLLRWQQGHHRFPAPDRAHRHDASAYAYAFDLLALDGEEMRGKPLADRKAALGKLLRPLKPGIQYSEHLTGDGAEIFVHACKLGLEGIVSKRLNSPYRSGKVKSGLKVKNPKAAAVLRIQEGGW